MQEHLNARGDLVPPAQRRAELSERFPGWTPCTTHEVLEEAARRHPDRPFVVTDERTWTYREIDVWADRVAAGLVASGVQAGEHVAVVMANYVEFVAVRYGIAKAGAVTVPVNFLNQRDELGYVLRQSDAVALVTMDRFRQRDHLRALDELAPGWEAAGGGAAFPRLREVFVFGTGGDPRPGARTVEDLCGRAVPGDGWRRHADPHAVCDVLYTSGTTGSPKGVVLTHDMLTRTAFGSVWVRAFQDGRRLLFSLPLYHVYGYVEGLLAVPFVGGSIVLQRAFDPVETLRAIERHRADDALFVPTMTLDVLDAARVGDYDLSSLRYLFSSGGQSPERIWDEIFEVLQPDELVTGYGMSETTASTTCTLPEGPQERLRTTNGLMKSVGPAADPTLPGGRLTDYKTVDPESGDDQPVLAVGELLVRGLGVTSEYYAKPQETAEAFTPDGWFRTGDLGRIDEEGYLTLIGRKKDCYRCGGEQVTPKEVEDVLTSHPAVAQAHVVPLRDERLGEVGVAYVVYKDGSDDVSEELLDHCRERLARFKVPRHVLSIAGDELPVTPSGRPRKFLLAERAPADVAARAAATHPGGP
jgi:fatty-acyl-CoA synthase